MLFDFGGVFTLSPFPVIADAAPEFGMTPEAALEMCFGVYDQDGPMAVETRRRLLDRAVADRLRVCGAHFPFPGSGVFSKDGAAYAFVPDTV